MCTTKAPKAPPPDETKNKPVQYLSNPWLDGLGIGGANARGRNSLRIDPGTPVPSRAPVQAPAPIRNPYVPSYGGGRYADYGGGGGGSSRSLGIRINAL